MNKGRSFLSPILYWLIAAYITLSFSALGSGQKTAALLLPEDHYFENLGALALFLSFCLFLQAFILTWRVHSTDRTFILKQAIYLGFALLFIFGAGEEISWGQRIFGFTTPQTLTSINAQQEFNIHNFSIFESSDLFTADRIFDLFWFSYALVIPLVAKLHQPFEHWATRLLSIPPLQIGSLFLLDYLCAKIAKLLYQGVYRFDAVPFVQAVQEIKESNYAILFVMAGLYAVMEIKGTNRVK